MEDVQSLWEVPSIGQFMSMFRNALHLPRMEIEELEQSFLASGEPDGSTLLKRLIIKLLGSNYPKRKNVTANSWEKFLRLYLHKRWTQKLHIPNPLSGGQRFADLDLKTRVKIVYSLCIYRLDSCNVRKKMKSMDSDSLRVQSLGSDSRGNVYWYFYGTRLYKEEPLQHFKQQRDWEEEWKQESTRRKLKKRGRGRPKKIVSESEELPKESSQSFLDLDSESRWSVVCNSLDDWKVFATKFKDSEFENEAALYQIITKNFLPVLHSFYVEKEKKQKKKQSKFAVDLPLKESENNVTADDNEPDKGGYCTSESEDSCPTKKPKLSRKIAKEASSQYEKTNRAALGIRSLCEYNLDKKQCEQNFSESPEIYVKLHQIIKSVKLHRDSWPFLKPVDEAIAPGYYNIIKDPIDLSAIERKTMLKVYNSIGQVDQDFQKMVYNCRLFNGAKSEYTEMAKTILHVFRLALFNLAKMMPPKRRMERMLQQRETEKPKCNILRKRNLRRKLRFTRRKAHRKTMAGLDMLAEASEQALKEASSSETELHVSGSQSVGYKSKAFPGLKIVPLQNHSPSIIEKFSASSNSSDSDSNPCEDRLPSSTRANDSLNGSGSSSDEQQKPVSPKRNIMNKFAHDTRICSDGGKERAEECRNSLLEQRPVVVSPDSCNAPKTVASRSDPSLDDRFSDNEPGPPDLTKNINEFDDTLKALGLSNESTKSDAFGSLSSIFSRIIRENQDFQISDLASLNYSEAVNEQQLNGQSPQSEELSKSCRGGLSLNQETSPPHLTLESVPNLAGLHPLADITTVDASVLGLSSGNICNGRRSGSTSHNMFASGHSSPLYCDKDSSHSFSPNSLANKDASKPSQTLPSLLPYPSPPYTNSSDVPEKISDNTLSRSKPSSPDSQKSHSQFSNSLQKSLSPHAYMPAISSSPVNSVASCPMQVMNTMPSVAGSAFDPNSRSLMNPLPLQMPITNLTFPLLPLMSQASDCATTDAMEARNTSPTTSSSQSVMRPVASLATNPVSHSSAIMAHNSFNCCGPQSCVPKNIKSSCNTKSPNNQKVKKRKRIAPRPAEQQVNLPPENCITSVHQVPVSSAFNLPNSAETPVSRSPQNKAVSPDSSSFGISVNMVSESGLKSYRESNLACTPALTSAPLFTPYTHNGFNSTPRLISSVADSVFWNATCPTYSLPTTHAAPASMLSAVTQSSFIPNGFSVASGENRLQPLCPVPTTAENTYSVQSQVLTEKNILSVPNTSPNAMFSSFPILYTVPTTSTEAVLQNAGKECLLMPNRNNVMKPSLQGIPPRPVQDVLNVGSQQLRPHYLGLPHYMLPPQPSLLPAPLMPTLTISSEPELRPEPSAVPQAGGKVSPIYTMLQNVPAKTR